MTDPLTEGIAAYDAQEYEKAYTLLYPLGAYSRDIEAQFYLGMIYFYGKGVEKNEAVAAAWWKKAMRGGHVDATYRLSEITATAKTTF